MDNRRYSILIVGFNCHYSHLNRFIKTLKSINPLVEITFLSDHYDFDLSDDIKNNVSHIIYRHFYSGKRLKCLRRFLNVPILIKQFRNLSKQYHFDIIDIHFPQYFMLFVWKYMKKMAPKIALSPWGSDVLRTKWRERFFLKYLYRKADMITIGHKGSFGAEIIRRFGVDKAKMPSLSWGSETIDYINERLDKVSVGEAKERLGLSGKYVITCGYNGFKAQRHDSIIDAIVKVKKQLPSNVKLVFPVTYGHPVEREPYVNSLKKRCRELNLDAVFYEDYLPVEDTFLLRRASDLFIHVQTTDAGNSTVMEYCICGSKIIHGSWMEYKWMQNVPQFYFPVDNLSDLPEVIVKAYQTTPPAVPEEVLQVIRDRGWKQKMHAWNEAFMSLLPPGDEKEM